MKTLYIADVITYENIPAPGKYFVIGVKDSYNSLEELEKMFGEKMKMERFPEVPNCQYIHTEDWESHILQPAFVTVKE